MAEGRTNSFKVLLEYIDFCILLKYYSRMIAKLRKFQVYMSVYYSPNLPRRNTKLKVHSTIGKVIYPRGKVWAQIQNNTEVY